jgi:transposase
MSGTAELPGSVVELRARVLEQQKRLEQQSLFIEQLLEQIRLARHQHFGSRSERFSVDQLALAFNEAEAAAAVSDDADVEQPDILGTVAVPAHRRAKGGRRPLPKAFPRVEIIHEIDAADCEGRLVTAPMPAQPIPRSFALPGTLALVAVGKYIDGLPLYRQEKQLARIGVQLPRSTLAHWMVKAGELVQPLVNLLRDRLLAFDIVCMDETRLQVLKEPGKRTESQSYLCPSDAFPWGVCAQQQLPRAGNPGEAWQGQSAHCED